MLGATSAGHVLSTFVGHTSFKCYYCLILLQGDALFAMELALSLEKLNFSKLRELNDVAQKHNDAQMCDFIGTAS